MKHKSSKRSILNKQTHHRSDVNQTRRISVPIDYVQTVPSDQIDHGTGTVLLDSMSPCLKPHHLFKSQKLLKRDLLRCSNQRPSLLGPQTLQPPRIHPRSQQNPSVASSSSTSSSSDRQRRRSLSVHSHTFYATIDRIGPWPDINISRIRADGNDLLRPLKNFRNTKNPRLFSPKYYSGLNDHTSKFKFHSSQHTYIDEYRQQKGYLLTPPPKKQQTSFLSMTSSKQIDDDQLSNSAFDGDRTVLSATNLSFASRGLTKSADNLSATNHSSTNRTQLFPLLSNRKSNSLRILRPMQHQELSLPALTTSFRYLNSMNAVEKTYHSNKKPSKNNQSKLYILDGRQKPSILSRINSASEVITSYSQDHLGLGTTGSPVTSISESTQVVTVYQLARRTQLVTRQNDIESFV